MSPSARQALPPERPRAPEASRPGARPAVPVGDVAVLLLADIKPSALPWGWSRFVLGGWPLRRTPGLGFARQLGSGHEGGFGLRPSGTRQGLFLLFDGEAAARDFLAHSPLVSAYRNHARESAWLLLRAFSCRGSWAGRSVGVSLPAPAEGPVAALTRASIRPSKSLRFWRHAPPSQLSLEGAAGCRLAVGLGEAPLVRQATFSVWDSVQAMDAYARHGAHMAAIRASMSGDFFSESMFVRFVVLEAVGQWKGRPLA